MAFPGTYNFNYYKADTFEFRVYPKDSFGEIFDLSSFDSVNFTISTARGAAGVQNQIEAYSIISDDSSHLLCAIRPSDGSNLNAGTQYVYDIEVSKSSTPYDITYTLLTGNITVTDQVTGAQ
jgi:hypothetical protein